MIINPVNLFNSLINTNICLQIFPTIQQHLLGTYDMPDTTDAGDTRVRKIDKEISVPFYSSFSKN